MESVNACAIFVLQTTRNMATKKYTGIILTQTTKYVSNDTCQVVELTSEQKLMDSIFGDKYTLVELVAKVGVIEANTLAALNDLAYDFASSKNVRDFSVYLIKNRA